MKRQLLMFTLAVVAVFAVATDAQAFGKHCRLFGGGGGAGGCSTGGYSGGYQGNVCVNPYTYQEGALYTVNVWEQDCWGNVTYKGQTQMVWTRYGWQAVTASTPSTPKTGTTPKTETAPTTPKTTPKFESAPPAPKFYEAPPRP